jgi:hypothetical protein
MINFTKWTAVIGGLLLSSAAMAAPMVVLTSDNLQGQYSLFDTGLYTKSGTNDLGNSNYDDTTTAQVLSTFQNVASGQWYQTTQFTTLTSYDNTLQDFSRLERYAYVSVNANVAGDQWIEMSFINTSIKALHYTATMSGTIGSRQSPRGNTQLITPAFGHLSDDAAEMTSVEPYILSNGAVYFNANGVVNKDVMAVAEATDGGTISFMDIYMVGDTTFSALRTEHYSYQSNQWTQDIAITTPVPEPETYALLLAGLGWMGAVVRRRKAARST